MGASITYSFLFIGITLFTIFPGDVASRLPFHILKERIRNGLQSQIIHCCMNNATFTRSSLQNGLTETTLTSSKYMTALNLQNKKWNSFRFPKRRTRATFLELFDYMFKSLKKAEIPAPSVILSRNVKPPRKVWTLLQPLKASYHHNVS